MHESQANSHRSSSIILLVLGWFLLATSVGGLTGCDNSNMSTPRTAPAAKDVIGLTEAELRAKYPEVTELNRSFDLLASKNLHPYHPLATNKLLRFGQDYLIAELRGGRVIALHHVGG
jgi:hypothetical protein